MPNPERSGGSLGWLTQGAFVLRGPSSARSSRRTEPARTEPAAELESGQVSVAGSAPFLPAFLTLPRHCHSRALLNSATVTGRASGAGGGHGGQSRDAEGGSGEAEALEKVAAGRKRHGDVRKSRADLETSGGGSTRWPPHESSLPTRVAERGRCRGRWGKPSRRGWAARPAVGTRTRNPDEEHASTT